MLYLGIILGFASATGASLSYLLSRQYLSRPGRSLLRLLAMAHVMQGALCLALLALVWPAQMPPWQQWAWPVVGTGLFFLIGQGMLFVALRYVEASRVAPLLGLKVVVVALLAVAVLGEPVPLLGWVAVAMTVTAAMLLNRIGGWIPLPAVLAVVVACLGYGTSDLHIGLSIAALTPTLSPLRAALVTVVLAYALCGAVMATTLPWLGSRRPAEWAAAAPYAALWLAAMMAIFACFALVGVVYGAMLQASRAVLSVALGWLIARLGHEHLEPRLPRAVFYRRLAAAVLMFSALALFGYVRSR